MTFGKALNLREIHNSTSLLKAQSPSEPLNESLWPGVVGHAVLQHRDLIGRSTLHTVVEMLDCSVCGKSRHQPVDDIWTAILIAFLKLVQLAISVGVIGLFWLIYPGAMVILSIAAGLCYVAAAVGAFFDVKIAIWLAFLFSILTAVFSTLGVSRFLRNDFDFIGGNFDGLSGMYLPPYLFLVISLVSTLAVLMHLASWRWTVSGSQFETA